MRNKLEGTVAPHGYAVVKELKPDESPQELLYVCPEGRFDVLALSSTREVVVPPNIPENLQVIVNPEMLAEIRAKVMAATMPKDQS